MELSPWPCPSWATRETQGQSRAQPQQEPPVLSLQPTPPQEPEPREGEGSSWGHSSLPYKSTMQPQAFWAGPQGHPGLSLPPFSSACQPACPARRVRHIWLRQPWRKSLALDGKSCLLGSSLPHGQSSSGVAEGGRSPSNSPAQESPPSTTQLCTLQGSPW